eukprot:2056980-Alexandrium_andersonii.AAC.1
MHVGPALPRPDVHTCCCLRCSSRATRRHRLAGTAAKEGATSWGHGYPASTAVSYTHLTLPTICSV